MGGTLTEQRRVKEEGIRSVNFCYKGRTADIGNDIRVTVLYEKASGNDYFFSNQLLPLVSSLSVEQRKMLIDFIELLKDYDVDKNNTKRG